MEKLRVRELYLYLNKHGLITVGRKLDKVKAFWCHYYQHNKEAVITELSSDEDDVESEDGEFEGEEAENDNDFVFFVFANLDEQSSPSATIQFISDEQITAVVVQGPWDVVTIIDITCILKLSICGGWERRGDHETFRYR